MRIPVTATHAEAAAIRAANVTLPTWEELRDANRKQREKEKEGK